jgi:hypothetical protein
MLPVTAPPPSLLQPDDSFDVPVVVRSGGPLDPRRRLRQLE